MDTINPPVMKETKRRGLMQAAIIIAIVIVMNMFFNYAISLAYVQPQYDTFCPASITDTSYATSDECVAHGGEWNEQAVPASVDATGSLKAHVSGYCDPTYTCQNRYDTATTVYNRNVFIILVALGVLSLVVAAFVGISLLSIAFSWGGVLSLVIASVRYWGNADNLIRVLILAAALAALIWLAVKKFSK